MAIRVAKQPRLPSAYQEVEYIQSTGTQYINTGIKGNSKLEFNFKFNLLSSSYQYLLGDNSVDDKRTGLCYYGNYYYPEFPNGQYTSISAVNIDYTCYLSTSQIILNNISTSLTSGNFDDQNDVFLFARRDNQGRAITNATMKLYYMKIENNGTLVRNFIPCYRKSDSVIGLYDLVNGVFYTNSGTGTFLMGRPINALPQGYQEVEYIKTSSKGQKLLTSIPINGEYKLEVLFQLNGDAWSSGTENIYRQPIIYCVQDGAEYICLDCNKFNSGCVSFSYNGNGSNTYNIYSYNVKRLFTFNQKSNGATAFQDNTQLMSRTYAELPNIKLSLLEGNSNTNTVGNFNGNIYFVRKYDVNDNVVNCLIPCYCTESKIGWKGDTSETVSSGTIGLYDIVENKFYINNGTGTFDKGDNISYYHNINPVMFGSPRLPSEYQEVEWIKGTSTETAVFNLPFYNSSTITNIKLDAEFEQANNEQYPLKCSSTNSKSMHIGINSNRMFALVNTVQDSTIKTISSNIRYLIDVNFSTNGISASVDGSTTSISTSNAGLSGSFEVATKSNSYIYSAIITQNSISYILIPCYRKSDNTIGLYDLTNKSFYENSGTGTLEKGADHDTYGHNIKKVMLGTADGVGVPIFGAHTVTIYGANSETITDNFGKTYITSSTGSVNAIVPHGNVTFTGSVSGYSKTVNITSNTTEVKVMPDGALYWYGNECAWITDGWTNSGYSYYTNPAQAPIKQLNNLDVFQSGAGVTMGGTNNIINKGTYTKIYTTCLYTRINGGYGGVYWGTSKTFNSGTYISSIQTTNVLTTLSANINGNYYYSCVASSKDNKIYAIWLE